MAFKERVEDKVEQVGKRPVSIQTRLWVVLVAALALMMAGAWLFGGCA